MGVQHVDWTSAFGYVLGTIVWVLENVSSVANGWVFQGVHPLPSSNLLDTGRYVTWQSWCFSKSLPLAMVEAWKCCLLYHFLVILSLMYRDFLYAVVFFFLPLCTY